MLFGIGDGALRPALVRLAAGGDGRAARRWSLAGLALTALAMGMMIGATYLHGVSGRAEVYDRHWLLR